MNASLNSTEYSLQDKKDLPVRERVTASYYYFMYEKLDALPLFLCVELQILPGSDVCLNVSCHSLASVHDGDDSCGDSCGECSCRRFLA